jgi:butyryl-CoA dehydrogenase
MDPLLSNQHRLIQQTARAFSQKALAPIAKDMDLEARFPWEVIEKMGKLGYFGVQVPRTLEGAGLDTMGYALIVEEISRAAASIGLCVSVHNSVVLHPLMLFGTPDQHRKWVPDLASGRKIGAFCLTEPNVGSDASAVEATAVLDGDEYIVNANKVFVTNGGVADVCLLFVRTDPDAGRRGISVIVVERGIPGFVVGDLEDLTGMRANPVSSIRMYDCRVPRDNLLGRLGGGLGIGLAALDAGRIGIAAQAVGISQAALDAAVDYARQRHQFGLPLARHQAIQMMLADMATQTEAARQMVYRAARLRDLGKKYSQAAAMAKLFAAEASGTVTDLAVQIFGGYGYSKAYAVERYWRDARVTRIYEGTSEVHRMVIARGVLDG